MALRRKFGEHLELIDDDDGARGGTHIGEGCVIVARSISDPVAPRVGSQGGNDHEVDISRMSDFSVRSWFEKPAPVIREVFHRFSPPKTRDESTFGLGVHERIEDGSSPSPELRIESPQVDLTSLQDGPKQSHGSRFDQLRAFQQSCFDGQTPLPERRHRMPRANCLHPSANLLLRAIDELRVDFSQRGNDHGPVLAASAPFARSRANLHGPGGAPFGRQIASAMELGPPVHDQDLQNQTGFLIPAYDPGPLLGKVISKLSATLDDEGLSRVPIVVVDDGCTDGACDQLPQHIHLLRHSNNRGKGAALQTGLAWARDRGLRCVVTVDADDQHPTAEAIRLLHHPAPADALVLAVRDMRAAGAPLANRFSNAFSNWVLSLFGGRTLRDTQCGLRRYPVAETLALGATHPGYAFESELVLRAARRGTPIVHVEATVDYPKESTRVSHFHTAKDPAKNVLRVIQTTWRVPHHRASRRWGRRIILFLIAIFAIYELTF